MSVDFALTDEQERLRARAHDFGATDIRSCALGHDRDGSWPGQVVERMWETGLLNPTLPRGYGGAALGTLETVLIGEEISWGCTAFSTIIGANVLAIGALTLGGSEALKRRYLGRLAEAPIRPDRSSAGPNSGPEGEIHCYVALGDSFTAGPGAEPVNSGPTNWPDV